MSEVPFQSMAARMAQAAPGGALAFVSTDGLPLSTAHG